MFFEYIFDAEATIKLPGYAVRYYTDGFASSRDALRGNFGFYRAWDTITAQNRERMTRRLTIPVLGFGGQFGFGSGAAMSMRLAADDVQELVIPGAGHFIAEEAPDAVLTALTAFLAPYRDAAIASRRRIA